MIYFYNIFSDDKNEIIEQEKDLLNNNLNNQNKKKDIILSYIKNFVKLSSNDSNSASTLLDILESLKDSLECCDKNITYLNSIVQNFDEVIEAIKSKSENLIIIADNFNKKYLEFSKLILDNTNKIEDCILKVSDIPKLTINTVIDNDNENIEQNTEPLATKNQSVEVPKVESNIENNNYQENTLTISESIGKVTLPYTISEVEEIFNNNPGKYNSIDGVIHKKFTLPLSMYKSPIISRFKEAFKLMKDKEKSSLSDAVSLGFELMFRSDIHPAIITACDSLDDLDAYLDYLDSDGKMDFHCFKIIFDFKPLSVKKRKNNFYI